MSSLLKPERLEEIRLSVMGTDYVGEYATFAIRDLLGHIEALGREQLQAADLYQWMNGEYHIANARALAAEKEAARLREALERIGVEKTTISEVVFHPCLWCGLDIECFNDHEDDCPTRIARETLEGEA